MPTENRSSNTEMVSVSREHELKIRQAPLADLLSGLKTGEIRDCSDREFTAGDTVLLREIDDDRAYTGRVERRTITHVQKQYGLPDHLCVLSYGQPAPHTHPDPIAWMVGTAFWWTKEEAERDAAETGLPIVGLGPMTESADIDQLQLEIAELQLALTMHDDAAIQDECIRAENSELHAKLAERNAAIIPELTSDLREILGRPNFTCHHIAKALRVMGLTIAPKSEDEQAAVIHWLLGHYLKHGADWRQRAAAELEAASETIKA
ncbi:DUF3850 domain-containing protein [Pseudomonas fulva]|uniref:DUF3850 domain-containing protein n=1 Tax=Pseudomonas fulva TaxID=47880 RepID=UPI003F935470